MVFRFQETQTRFVGWRVKRLRRLYRLAEPAIDTPEWRTWLAWDPYRAITEQIRLARRGPARAAAAIRCRNTALAPTLSTATAG
ncbi:hypothetical protein [Sphingosinicella sp. CPCC 101087]|uniref:hypothetical protein n=1 Tax=Sphingosinicella sp. CPCC 101087 TaxID=2497754 RepID=UPI00101BDF3A|nr:hypothetical protein [Sphingosinicella sp. CPCC 101087]